MVLSGGQAAASKPSVLQPRGAELASDPPLPPRAPGGGGAMYTMVPRRPSQGLQLL
jgi:hypothetical protein